MKHRLCRVFWDLAYRSGAPWDSGLPADELIELVQSSRLNAGRVLDIGCGTGTNVLFLAERGFDASGIDISRVAIKRAVAKARERSLKCSFYLLDFTETEAVSKTFSTFDILLDVGCLHSLSARDREMYVDSLKLISRPGSLYLLWCFLRGRPWAYGPPGVDEQEVERRLSDQFLIIEKRRLSTSLRDMLYYRMKREG